jgi:hypothetical protein
MESVAESALWRYNGERSVGVQCGRVVWERAVGERSRRGSLVIAINLRQLRTEVHGPDNLRPGVGLSLLTGEGDDYVNINLRHQRASLTTA